MTVAPNGDMELVQIVNMPCVADQNVNLTPGEVYKVPIKCQNLLSCCMSVYSDQDFDSDFRDKVRGLDGICDGDSNFIYMLASTPTNIKEGDKVGSINSVVECEWDSSAEGDSENAKFNMESFSLGHLSHIQRTKVADVLKQHQEVFSAGESDIGKASVTEHKIILNEQTPIYQQPRRFPQLINYELDKQRQELCAADVIEPSISPWSSPIVPVRKKDGSIRTCIDYRKLNAITIPDRFPVPNLLGTPYLGYTEISISPN